MPLKEVTRMAVENAERSAILKALAGTSWNEDGRRRRSESAIARFSTRSGSTRSSPTC